MTLGIVPKLSTVFVAILWPGVTQAIFLCKIHGGICVPHSVTFTFILSADIG